MAGKVMHLANGHLGWGVILLFTITAAMSMWISNTATTAMMLPLAIGMLARLDSKKSVPPSSSYCWGSPTAPVSAASVPW